MNRIAAVRVAGQPNPNPVSTMRYPALLVLVLTAALSVRAATAPAKYPTGTVVTAPLHSAHLENKMGENATRSVSVYLPPGYSDGTQRYPVI